LSAARYWLVLGAALCVVAHAEQPPPPTSPDLPDEEFIEFLGADDHGDVAWWELLKKASPGTEEPTAPPPQDAKQ